LPLCENLEEIRLNNCGIKDEGALILFEELKGLKSVRKVELN
jgi:hypothetical protein